MSHNVETDEIYFEIPEFGLKIYRKKETYLKYRHIPSFIFWELVEFVSNSIVFVLTIIIWEFFLEKWVTPLLFSTVK